MIGSGDTTSITLIRQVMMGELMGIPQLYFCCVDVRDCSIAHLRALLRPNAANRRFILSIRGNSPMEEIAINLRDDLIAMGKNYPVTTRVVGYCSLKFVSYFSSDVGSILPLINRRTDHQNAASIEILGIQY